MKKYIIVHHVDDETESLAKAYPWAKVTRDDSLASATFMPFLRFSLTSAEPRLFSVERYVFRGEGRWWQLGSPAKLESLVDTYVCKVGRESFYDLMD